MLLSLQPLLLSGLALALAPFALYALFIGLLAWPAVQRQ